jgi:hypothetical protein
MNVWSEISEFYLVLAGPECLNKAAAAQDAGAAEVQRMDRSYFTQAGLKTSLNHEHFEVRKRNS